MQDSRQVAAKERGRNADAEDERFVFAIPIGGKRFAFKLILKLNRRHGDGGAVRQRERDVANSQVCCDLGGTAGEVEGGTLSGQAANLDLLPCNPVLNAGAKSLGASLLGRETCREALGVIFLALAVGNLRWGKDAGEEARAKTGYGLRDAIDFYDVDAGSNEHEGKLNHF
jgi:hypothetical protein